MFVQANANRVEKLIPLRSLKSEKETKPKNEDSFM